MRDATCGTFLSLVHKLNQQVIPVCLVYQKGYVGVTWTLQICSRRTFGSEYTAVLLVMGSSSGLKVASTLAVLRVQICSDVIRFV